MRWIRLSNLKKIIRNGRRWNGPLFHSICRGGRQSRRRVGKFEVQSRSRCTRYRCLVVCWSRNNNSLMVAGTRRVTRSASISLLCCSFFVFGRLLHLAVLLFGLFFSTLWRRQKKKEEEEDQCCFLRSANWWVVPPQRASCLIQRTHTR